MLTQRLSSRDPGELKPSRISVRRRERIPNRARERIAGSVGRSLVNGPIVPVMNFNVIRKISKIVDPVDVELRRELLFGGAVDVFSTDREGARVIDLVIVVGEEHIVINVYRRV